MSRSRAIVRNNGGDLVRVLEALNGFKAKHGSWPTELLISRVTLANLKEHHLTELGFALLENRVRLLGVGDYKLNWSRGTTAGAPSTTIRRAGRGAELRSPRRFGSGSGSA